MARSKREGHLSHPRMWPLTCGYVGALGGTRTPNLLIRRELHACSLPGGMCVDLLRWCQTSRSGWRLYAPSYGQIQAIRTAVGSHRDGKNTVKQGLTVGTAGSHDSGCLQVSTTGTPFGPATSPNVTLLKGTLHKHVADNHLDSFVILLPRSEIAQCANCGQDNTKNNYHYEIASIVRNSRRRQRDYSYASRYGSPESNSTYGNPYLS